MYIIEVVDDWDRTIQTWVVNRSEEEVSDFVNTMNSGLADKLRREVKSNRDSIIENMILLIYLQKKK